MNSRSYSCVIDEHKDCAWYGRPYAPTAIRNRTSIQFEVVQERGDTEGAATRNKVGDQKDRSNYSLDIELKADKATAGTPAVVIARDNKCKRRKAVEKAVEVDGEARGTALCDQWECPMPWRPFGGIRQWRGMERLKLKAK